MRLKLRGNRKTTILGALVLLWTVVALTLAISPIGGPAWVWADDSTASPTTQTVAQSPASPAAEPKGGNEKAPLAPLPPVMGEKKSDRPGAVKNRVGEKILPDVMIQGDRKADRKGGEKDVRNNDNRKAPDEKLGSDDRDVAEKGGRQEGPASKESFLTWLYSSLGLRYVVIFLIITFNAVALVVMILLGLRRKVICPDDLITSFETKLNEKKYQEAYELAKANRSFLGKVLAAGMARLPDGYDDAMRAMQEAGEDQNMKMEQRNGYIALIAQIGPMFGLLGTVDGMVMAFDVIAHSNVTPKPSELAQGIGTALVTTVVGLWIAIPCIAFYHIVRNRLTRLVGEVGVVSGNLMKRFAGVQVAAKKAEK